MKRWRRERQSSSITSSPPSNSGWRPSKRATPRSKRTLSSYHVARFPKQVSLYGDLSRIAGLDAEIRHKAPGAVFALLIQVANHQAELAGDPPRSCSTPCISP